MTYKFNTGGKVELELFDKAADQEIKLKSILEVCDGDERFVIHSPIHEGKIYLIDKGVQVKMFFLSMDAKKENYEVYSFFANVVAREMRENIPMLTLHRTSDIVKVQRRDYFRLSYVKDMQVKKINDDDAYDIVCRDISLGGMRFVSNETFCEGEQVLCAVNFEDEEIVELAGMVIGIDDMNDGIYKKQLRVKFEPMESELRMHVIKWINRLQAAYIKKVSGETYERNLKQILPQFSSEKLENYGEKQQSLRNIGYLKGLINLFSIIALSIYYFAQPRNHYPIAKLLGISYTNGWSKDFLNIGFGISAVLVLASLVVVALERSKLEDGERDKFILFNIVFAMIMILLFVYRIMTVF